MYLSVFPTWCQAAALLFRSDREDNRIVFDTGGMFSCGDSMTGLYHSVRMWGGPCGSVSNVYLQYLWKHSWSCGFQLRYRTCCNKHLSTLFSYSAAYLQGFTPLVLVETRFQNFPNFFVIAVAQYTWFSLYVVTYMHVRPNEDCRFKSHTRLVAS